MFQEEILSGHFRDMDDLLTEPLQALREKKCGYSRCSSAPEPY